MFSPEKHFTTKQMWSKFTNSHQLKLLRQLVIYHGIKARGPRIKLSIDYIVLSIFKNSHVLDPI